MQDQRVCLERAGGQEGPEGPRPGAALGLPGPVLRMDPCGYVALGCCMAGGQLQAEEAPA
jgi:hypothetical protein